MSSAISGLSTTSPASSSNAFGSMTSEDFIKILTQQMANQDPFKPQDSGALLEQLSSLRNVESQLMLGDNITQLVLQNQVATAGGLIGRNVEGKDPNNNAVNGLVTAVRVQDGKAVLELDSGKSLPMDRVTRIIQTDTV